MAYIPFSILAVSAMFLLALTPIDTLPETVQTNQNSLDSYNMFHGSVEQAHQERLEVNLEEYIYEVNQTLDDEERQENPANLDAEDYADGNFESNQMINYSMNQWVSDIENVSAQSAKDIELRYDDLEFEYDESNEVLTFSANLTYRTSDNLVGISRDFEETVEQSIDLEPYGSLE